MYLYSRYSDNLYHRRSSPTEKYEKKNTERKRNNANAIQYIQVTRSCFQLFHYDAL